jgi:hypothetical protein
MVRFRTPNRGKNTHVEKVARREALDARELEDPNRTQLRAESLTPPWGNTNAPSPERRALVALVPLTVKHISYRRAEPSRARQAHGPQLVV